MDKSKFYNAIKARAIPIILKSTRGTYNLISFSLLISDF